MKHNNGEPLPTHCATDMQAQIIQLLASVLSVVLLILSAAACSTSGTPSVVARYGQSVRGEVDGVGFLVLRGTPEEQGEAHGVLAAEDILRLLNETLVAQVEKHPGAWDAAIIPVVKAFDFPAHFEAELEAVFRGLQKALPDPDDRKVTLLGRKISIEDLQALNCIGDIMSARSRIGDEGCSSFSVWGALTPDEGIMSARNLDYATFPGKVPFLVIAREPVDSDRLATLDLSGPGVLGVSTAMNAEGIVLMQHDEDGLAVEATTGFTPRLLVNRDAIERLRLGQNLDQIAQLFSNKTTITGTNTHISFPSRNPANGPRACVVEWDGNPMEGGATVRLSDAHVEANALFCTNHYLRRREPKAGGGSSQSRMTSLVEAIRCARTKGAAMGLEEAKQAMDAVAASGDGVTYLTAIVYPDERRIVFATTPDTGVPATKGRWVEIHWDDIFEMW